MIRSMTAFGNARAESAEGSVTIELRSVNSRFLDLNFRLPDDLRAAEGAIREKISRDIIRGKVDVRANYVRNKTADHKTIDLQYLKTLADQLQAARQIIPDVVAPAITDIVNGSNHSDDDSFSPDALMDMCARASAMALADLQANREREGERLAAMMRNSAAEIDRIVNEVEHVLPRLLADHREKLTAKLHDTLAAVHPEGFAQISGAELSARIAQETSLFSLRIDVAEELSRLRSHIAELILLVANGNTDAKTALENPAAGTAKTARKAHAHNKGKPGAGSTGKRLDFLFQEMNREANTLGSKASDLSVTRAAIDLKLLIEQMREQAQNIE